MILKKSDFLEKNAKNYSDLSLGIESDHGSSSDQSSKLNLYAYKFHPQMLKKSITPLLIEPKFLDNTHDHLNLRILLNPKFKESFSKMDLRIMTQYSPQRNNSLGINSKITKDGIEKTLILGDFGNDLSWKTKISLNKGNIVLGVWLIANFNTILFPKFMPKIGMKIQDEFDHFAESGTKEIACDKKLIFEYQRKLINF